LEDERVEEVRGYLKELEEKEKRAQA